MVFGYDSLFQPNVGSNQIRLRSIARSLLQELIDERSDETVELPGLNETFPMLTSLRKPCDRYYY